jgi:integrase
MAQYITPNNVVTYIQMNPATTIDKFDPHNSKQRYLRIKSQLAEGIPELPQETSSLLYAFLQDMEIGINVSSTYKKGSRSYIRLLSVYIRLKSLFSKFHEQGVFDITQLKEEDIIALLSKIEHGEIRRDDGKLYKSSADYLQDFKVFWHWYIRVQRKKSITIEDITQHIAASKKDPDFVYITLDELITFFFPEMTFEEKTLSLFLFDTIMRAPTEVSNIRVSDIYNDFKEVKIRDECSKTYGRTISLHLSSEMLKTYIETKCLQPNDYIFKFSHVYFNRKLKKIAYKKFGNTPTLGGKLYKDITGYAFRHSGAIHWRKTKYKSNIDALMYRGGWSDLSILNYYTRRIGMSDLKTNEQEQQAQSQSLDSQNLYRMIEKQSAQIEQLTAMLIKQQALPQL